MRAFSVLVALLLSASCADDRGSSSPTTSSSPRFVSTDCPVNDETFCATATEAANALATRDAEALLALSRSDTIVCAEMAVEYFPGCVTEELLEGHGVSGPDLLVNIVAESDYIVHLRGTTEELDSQSLQLLGVGTCGPDSPAERTYHLSWTATVIDVDGTAIPIVGSFEFTFVDEWRIVLFYVGTLDDWEAQSDDPLRDSFCEAGRTPWRN